MSEFTFRHKRGLVLLHRPTRAPVASFLSPFHRTFAWPAFPWMRPFPCHIRWPFSAPHHACRRSKDSEFLHSPFRLWRRNRPWPADPSSPCSPASSLHSPSSAASVLQTSVHPVH